MKKRDKFSILIILMWFFTITTSCNDDRIDHSTGNWEKGAALNMAITFETMTRVGELPNTDSMNVAGTSGLRHVGLYVYYTEDYSQGIVTQPYIRNLECRIENGKLIPVGAADNTTDEYIYIYDNMTLVAFYPYNADVADFQSISDENNYPITRSDYSQQTYIPYRGQTTADPTTAFYIQLPMSPKHTFKMEIILVSDNTADFHDGSDNIKILPEMDPADGSDPAQGRREKWYDNVVEMPQGTGGSHVRRYVAYIWQTPDMPRMIERNDVLFENDDFTLLASEQVDIVERRVYRYGYNMTTGEVFIPTSSTLVNNAETLQAFNNAASSAVYQVCDINLQGVTFTPLSVINSTYDGGGHRISNLQLSGDMDEAGLFRQVLGNSNLKNINLTDPVLTINSTSDTCYVGALCGRVNNLLDSAEIVNLTSSLELPENLSQVVKDALLSQLLADAFNSQSQIIACRVENPQITVTGTYPRVGTICGSNGDKTGNDSFKGYIWDTYSLGGSISVNSGNPALNEGAAVGGFCGLNQFAITRSYTTIAAADMDAEGNVEVPNPNPPGGTTTEVQDIWQGFANQGDHFAGESGVGISNSYSIAPDANTGVSQMPGSNPPSSWIMYSGIWPINVIGWTSPSGSSYWYEVGNPPANYPTLQWERR